MRIQSEIWIFPSQHYLSRFDGYDLSLIINKHPNRKCKDIKPGRQMYVLVTLFISIH